MKKLGALIVLSVALVFCSFNTPAFAESEPNVESKTNADTIKEQLSELEKQTDGLEILDSNELPEGTPFINFDSVEEFEKAIEAVQEIEKNNEEKVEEFFENSSSVNPKYSTFATMAATKNGTSRIKWRSAESFDYVYKVWLPGTMWIDFEYTYTGSGSSKKFKKITKVTSHSSGFPSSWIQSTKSTSFYDSNRGVKINIKGYHLLGVNIGGHSIGAKFPDSYTKKYHF